MSTMGSLNGSGDIPYSQIKCQNCLLDVSTSPAAQIVRCPRCGCGVMIGLQNTSKRGQPTQDARQYTDGALQHSDFNVIRPVSPEGN